MDLDDIREILDLVREHDLAEFELERDGLKVRVRKAAGVPSGPPVSYVQPVMTAAPPALTTSASAGQPAAAGPTPEGLELAVIKSPIVGTLYRAPEPGAPPFVEVGSVVKKGEVLCIIEAMKLMNEIESDCDGEVAAVYVENGQPVQFGDRLFAIRAK
jgi:acetyl-CoA carboxylase biotin carboxyl carrier protein